MNLESLDGDCWSKWCDWLDGQVGGIMWMGWLRSLGNTRDALKIANLNSLVAPRADEENHVSCCYMINYLAFMFEHIQVNFLFIPKYPNVINVFLAKVSIAHLSIFANSAAAITTPMMSPNSLVPVTALKTTQRTNVISSLCSTSLASLRNGVRPCASEHPPP